MQLCMYRRGDESPRTGLCDVHGTVFALDEAVAAVGGSSGFELPDVLAVIDVWDQHRDTVLAAIDRASDGRGPDPVSDARVTVPFPVPRRDAFAIGGNYAKHVHAASMTTGLKLGERKFPTFFMKPTGAFNGPTDAIEYDPSFTTRVDYEVELGVVLGRGGRDISQDHAMSHVFGYMVVNDVSARDIMLRNKPMVDHFRGKGLDTFFPMGPGVTPRELVNSHRGLRLRTWVNDDLRQDATTDELVRDVPEIIAELSTSMTLLPGDIIATGTPAGVAQEMDDPLFLQDGDLVEVEVESLGRLANPVRTR